MTVPVLRTESRSSWWVGGHYLSHIIAQISTASQQLVKFCIVLAIGPPTASGEKIHTTL